MKAGLPVGQQELALTELAWTAQKHRRTIGDRKRMPVRLSSKIGDMNRKAFSRC
ncbi:MAG: hypothetical protein MUC60_09735 [Oscillatoria sp. Prado101]|nr:hypothetical protein [Oscillatoria sp. Prado101]